MHLISGSFGERAQQRNIYKKRGNEPYRGFSSFSLKQNRSILYIMNNGLF